MLFDENDVVQNLPKAEAAARNHVMAWIPVLWGGGSRADDEKPVTKTNITKDDIARDYTTQDIPLLLRDAPSINSYTESGVGGSGYSYITLRGVSPTRINFTLDGVPLSAACRYRGEELPDSIRPATMRRSSNL